MFIRRLRAVLVLNPGSNGDGRGGIDDPVWLEFAAKAMVTERPFEP